MLSDAATNLNENPKPDKGHRLGGGGGPGEREPKRTPKHMSSVVVCAEHRHTLNPKPLTPKPLRP